MSVTAAKGFEAAGVAAGIRPSGAPDVALVRSTVPAVGAAMWTANRLQAAPVIVSRRHLAEAAPQAVVVNAGVANAATGAQGEADAVATAECVAGLLGVDANQVVVLSTGVIGPKLPLDRVRAGITEAVAELSPGRRAPGGRRDSHDRFGPEAGRGDASEGSPSAGWRKGRG